MKKLLMLFVVIYTCSVNALSDNEADFNEICKIYTEAISSNMTKEQLSDYIFTNVEHRIRSKETIGIHEAIFQLDPSKRYEVFKESAELLLQHSWDCDAVKKLMQ